MPRWEFVHVSLDDPPPYLAISYVWGVSRPTQTLHGSHGSFALSRNTQAILEYLFTAYEPGTHIWIDTLCINQSDNREKSSQIQLMREVYTSSTLVLAWLGDLGIERSAFELSSAMDEINSHAKWCKDGGRFDKVDPWRAPLGCQCRRDRGRDTLVTIAPLLELPWFKRSWVFQEVVSGSGVVMVSKCAGKMKEILWDDFLLYLADHNVLQFGDTFGTDSRTYGSSNASIMAGHRLLCHGDKDHPPAIMPLQTLLVECAPNFQATDPRDRIYALLGLSDDINFQFLEADYAEPVEALFTNTACLILTLRMIPTSSPFVLLSFAGIGRPRNLESLPSWVPDWTSSAQTTGFINSNVIVRTTHFEAVAERAKFDATGGWRTKVLLYLNLVCCALKVLLSTRLLR
jgi:hypothetical protein